MDARHASDPTGGGILYYVSAHGYGHSVRTCDILGALARAHPDIPVEVNSATPEPFFRNRLPLASIRHRTVELDVGMVQLDSVRVDVEATLERVQALWQRSGRLLDAECRHLERSGARLVVSDIPSLPLEAAARVGCPGVAIGNFAWNWIYSCFVERDARWGRAIERFERGYERASLLLRLPFAEPMSVFPVRRDLPLLARPSAGCRDELARRTGADPEKPWVLLSFTSLDWNADALARIEDLSRYVFFTVRPLAWPGRNLFAVDRNEVSFARVLASVDLVVTKPGYGILSECIVNRKPMVFVDREDFIEYPILEAAVRRYLAHAHVPASDLYAGRLGNALEAARACPWPAEVLAAGGDEEAAQILHAQWAMRGA